MVRWRAVPKSVQKRLHMLHESVLEFIKESGRDGVEEYFGVTWNDLDRHAGQVIRSLHGFVNRHIEDGVPLDRTLGTVYTLGFLTGVRFANDEDHEPLSDN